MSKTPWITTLILLLACGQMPSTNAADGVQELRSPAVDAAENHDVSPPLYLMEPAPEQSGLIEHEVKPIPRHYNRNVSGADPVRQSAPIALLAPAPITNFDGVGNGFTGPQGTFTVNAAPPDTNGDVGPNHYVQIVNTDFAIFNKSGTAVYGPVPVNTLWSGFGGLCQTDNDGDPIVLYDPIADRWLISQFAVTSPNPNYYQCVAISQTPDPTGAYNRYSFPYTAFPDYPKFGVWPDGYYVTYNMFTGGSTFAGAKICAMDRTHMLTGAAATQQCFNTSTSYGGLLPSDLDGASQPPAGSPNYVVGLGATANTLAFWTFHVDWTTPANSTFTGPVTLNSANYAEACNGGTCIPQSGTNQQLDSLADRLMFRLAYRNLGDHEALVVNHSITAGSSTGVRWYELRPDTNHNLSIFQQGTYAPDALYRWMGSAAMDQAGNIAIGFSVSSSSTKPAIHYTGRLAGDSPGLMTQGEASLIDGAGSQLTNLSRWGDYSMLAVDPSDDCTFWVTSEYIPSNGTFNWKTRIGSFKLPGCPATPPPTNDFSISANPSALSIQQGQSGNSTISTAVTRGSAETVTFSASGQPAGVTVSFSPGSVTAGGSSTMTVTVAAGAATGSSSITVTGTATSATHATSVSLTVSPPPGSNPIVNGGFEAGNLSGWTSTGSTSVVGTSHSGSWAAQVGSTNPGTDSSIAQTFVATSGGGTLSFWYQIHCPDTITYDWASATLTDNTAGTSTTMLANTCSNDGTWHQATTSIAASAGGHSFTLKLANHDDNYPGDPTYTWYDDVVYTSNAPPAPDFTIAATPSSQTVVQGNGTSYTATVTAQNGFTGTVNFSVTGLPTGAGGTFTPASVNGSGTSTLSVTTATTTPTGSYPLTITGTSGSITHTAGVTLVVQAPSDFSISASPASQSVNQGSSTTYTVSTAVTSGAAQSVSLSASGLPAGASASFNPASVTAGNSSTLTVSTSSSTPVGGPTTLTITGSGSTTHATTVQLTVTAPPANPIVNGGFETGNFSGWTTAGATSISTTAHSGTYSALVGSANPFNGDSSIRQTFTAPAGTGHTLTFWYRVVCTDSVTYDWATATLKDNTTNTTTTVLARTCTNNGTWVQKSASLTGGHSYTLTLIDHDDNWASPPDPTYTLYDDVTVQ
ncbi:MAG: hypothetical protein E6J78_16170 [Deltaproteobacteria bacterium]|nr:MAG: hypothetical protein E6J78_16170 [Deltaproteobacteria bacterium]